MYGELDITKKIKIIEQLKSQLLTDLSNIYSNMASDGTKIDENIDILADMIILSYFLSDHLGTSFEGLEMKIRNKLKLAILNEKDSSPWKKELNRLARYFDQ